jgi:hypothetical protein
MRPDVVINTTEDSEEQSFAFLNKSGNRTLRDTKSGSISKRGVGL